MKTLTDTWSVTLNDDSYLHGAIFSLNLWLSLFAAERADVRLTRKDGRLVLSATVTDRRAESRLDRLRLFFGRRLRGFFICWFVSPPDETHDELETRFRRVIADEPGARHIQDVSFFPARGNGTFIALMLFDHPFTRWDLSKHRLIGQR